MQRLPARLLIPMIFTLALGLVSASAVGRQDTVPKGAFIGAKPTEYPAWFKQSFLELEADVQEAAEQDKQLLILFHQDGCPYCNALVERNLSQKDIERRLRDDFDVIALNMWGDREVLTLNGRQLTEKQFAAAMQVQFTPTLIFLDGRGRQILRLNGYLPPDRFKLALDYVARKDRGGLKFRDYVARHQSKAAAPRDGGLNRQDFFVPGAVYLRGLGEERIIALFFEQQDCPQCNALHQGPLRDEEVRRTARQPHCVQLDMWSDQPVIMPDGARATARELAERFSVKYAPTILLLDSKGGEIIRNEAQFKTFHTNGILEYARSGGYRRQPSFQRWLEARADRLMKQGVDVNIWK